MSDADAKNDFINKYVEFAKQLAGVCPELAEAIAASLRLPPAECKKRFRSEVLPFCSPNRDAKKRPEFVLPGVPMPEEIWSSLSEKSQQSVQEFLTVLAFFLLMESVGEEDTSAAAGGGENPFGAFGDFDAGWAKKMMEEMKDKMKHVDFNGLSEKFAKLFGSFGTPGSSIPQLPEKFLKGQIARLAEEIVSEFKIEEFGIDPAAMEAAGNDPSKAIGLMTEVFMKNPAAFQKTILKLTKKLQQKVQSGAIRPKELVAEAEELMKTFSENPQFVEMMETFRQAFGMEGHEEEAKAAGRDGSARLSIVQARLRKKLEAKKAASGGGK